MTFASGLSGVLCRELILGPSLTKFMKTLGVYSGDGGNVHTKEHPRRRRAGRSGAQ